MPDTSDHDTAPSANSGDPVHHAPSTATEPLVPVAVLLITGIIAGRSLPAVNAGTAIWAAVITFALWIALVLRFRPGSPPAPHAKWIDYSRQALLGLTLCLCGVVLLKLDTSALAQRSISRSLPAHHRVLADLRMEVVTAPRQSTPSQQHTLFRISSPVTTFCGRVTASRAGGLWRRADGLVQVRAAGTFPALMVNQQIEAQGWLARLVAMGNPGGFDDRAYLAKQRIFAELSTPHPSDLRIINAHQQFWPLTGLLDAYRQHLRHVLLGGRGTGGVSGHAMVALLLGYRDRSIRGVARAFSMAGAAHLLALSGMHVVIIAGAIWFLLRLLIARPRRRAVVTLAVVLLYMVMTPCGPPVVRAALGAVLVLLAMLQSRRPRILNILAATAIVVLIWSPMELFEAPFQLSFLTTLGLISLAPRVFTGLFGAWLRKRAELARAAGSRWAAVKVHLIAVFLGALTANLIGSFIAFPLVAYHYHQVNPLAICNGLILLPLVTLVLICGMLQLLAGLLWMPLGHFMTAISQPVVHLLVWTVRHLAYLPGSNICVRAEPGFLVWGFFALILLWIFRRSMKLSRADITIAFALWLTLLTGFYAWTQPDHRVRLLVLAAGSGNASILETPGGKVLVINAGTLGSPGRLAGRITSAMKIRGLSSISAVIAAQIDSAHAAALPKLIARYPSASALTNRADLTQFQHRASEAALIQDLRTHGHILLPLAGGDRIRCGSGVTIHVLYPAGLPARRLRGLIMRFSFAGRNLLMLSRSQGAGAVLKKLHFSGSIAAVVLTGSGDLKPGMAFWLKQLNPHLIVLSGESRTAAAHDRSLCGRFGLVCAQTAALGAIELTMGRDGVILSLPTRHSTRPR